ncbi:hypothetical protein GJU42_12270 [Flavobacterium resistens]|uniref:Uncharacterized protein n=1 Tax=Flavobacterium resistens TaxID=443612 RepID=A0ABW9Q6W3_9FLAO|nr:hypothetical protein [Flavobacterium resistens]
MLIHEDFYLICQKRI